MKKIFCVWMVFVLAFAMISTEPLAAEAAMYTPEEPIYAESYMLINLADNAHPVIAEKNSTERLYPASLTKIVTAMVVLENVNDLNQTAVMSQAAFDESVGRGAQVAGIAVGEGNTIDELLQLTLVYSACDACEVLAEFAGGTHENFVAMMNNWAQSVGCTDTHFANPSGLHEDNHYSTAADMAKITLAALNNDNFVRYATALKCNYHGSTFYNTNFMLNPNLGAYYYEWARGIKTGSTSEAGTCVITEATKDDQSYLAIVMKSPQQVNYQGQTLKGSFVDAKNLFNWAFTNLHYQTILSPNEIISEIAVRNARKVQSVPLMAESEIKTTVPADFDKSALTIRLPDEGYTAEAPLKAGEHILTAEIVYQGQVLTSVDLAAAQDVKLSIMKKAGSILKTFFSFTAVKIILAVMLIFFIICIILRRRKIKKLKARRAMAQERKMYFNNDDWTNYNG